MKISQIIKNITEIQDPLWVANLSDEEIEKIEDKFYLVWMKLKQINDIDIFEPLVKISEYLTIKETKGGKLKVKMRDVEFRHFYSICINLIPKKKYKFIYAKKRKKIIVLIAPKRASDKLVTWATVLYHCVPTLKDAVNYINREARRVR